MYFKGFFPPKSPIFNKSSHIVNDVIGKYSAVFNNCQLNELSSESLEYALNEHHLELSTMTQS